MSTAKGHDMSDEGVKDRKAVFVVVPQVPLEYQGEGLNYQRMSHRTHIVGRGHRLGPVRGGDPGNEFGLNGRDVKGRERKRRTSITLL